MIAKPVDAVFLVASAVFQLLHLLTVLTACGGGPGLLRLASGGGRCLLRLLRSMRREAFCDDSGQANKLTSEVQARIRQWQTDQMRSSASVMALIYLYQVGEHVGRIFVKAPGDTAPLELAGIFAGYASVLLVMLCPKCLSTRSLDIWFVLLALPLMVQRSQVLCPGFSCAWTQPNRLCLSVILVGRMEGGAALAMGVVWWVSPIPLRWGVPAYFSLDAMIFVSASLLSLYMKERTWQQLKTTVEVEFLQKRQVAFRALLKNFYDVVLELDTELRIIGPAQELAIFLLYGAHVSLQGRHFQEFLKEDEDRPGVLERLQFPSKEQCSIAEVVHVQMRGINRTALEAELFCFGFESLGGGGTCYVIGIREYSDEMHGVPKKLPHGQRIVSADHISPEQVSVTVDTSDAVLPILHSSGTFQVLVGPAPVGSGLSHRVSSGPRFSGWVQSTMNQHLAGWPASELQPYEMKFKAVRGVQTQAVCRLTVAEPSSDEEEEHDSALVATLVFSGVERRRRRSARSAGSSSGGVTVSDSSSGSSLPSCAANHHSGRRPRGTLGPVNIQRPQSPALARRALAELAVMRL